MNDYKKIFFFKIKSEKIIEITKLLIIILKSYKKRKNIKYKKSILKTI